jgi:hypothetical protein
MNGHVKGCIQYFEMRLLVSCLAILPYTMIDAVLPYWRLARDGACVSNHLKLHPRLVEAGFFFLMWSSSVDGGIADLVMNTS